MSENTNDQHKDLRENKHGIATIVGLVICVAYGLIARNDLLFGLVTATVYTIGMSIVVITSKRFAGSGQGKLTPARFIGALAVGIAAALAVAVVLAAVDPLSIEGENIIITIIKHFFDDTVTIAFVIGALVGSVLHGMDSD